ncbi:hypothetical protein DER45DRAFT_382983 [Fusarium avenaceum]|nr:hypothetical protein DER45DRAFT_382983 [Fusarium avenaceum]
MGLLWLGITGSISGKLFEARLAGMALGTSFHAHGTWPGRRANCVNRPTGTVGSRSFRRFGTGWSRWVVFW